jgi:hypothetical protein
MSGEWLWPVVIDMVVAMSLVGLGAWPRSLCLRPEAPRRGLEARSRGRRHKGSFLADQRGAVAFETLIVYSFMVTALLLPLADVAAAGFQFISAWEALRGFGQYVQYHMPTAFDATSISTWQSTLPSTVAGYSISTPQLLCGDPTPPATSAAACSSTNTASPKYYSYTATVTVSPLVLRSAICTSSNANPCSFTLPYSERFQ